METKHIYILLTNAFVNINFQFLSGTQRTSTQVLMEEDQFKLKVWLKNINTKRELKSKRFFAILLSATTKVILINKN